MKLHLPRTRSDWIVAGWFWLGGICTLLYELFVEFPFYHQDPWNQPILIYQTALGTTLAFLVYTYMLRIMATDVTLSSLETRDDEFKIGWKFCDKCQQKSPPRSHHCKLCNVCILKRDHHCYFAGYCIGFQNQRYFIPMLIYASFAGIFCNVYNWDFVMSVKGGFTWTTIPSLLAPHVGYSFGYCSFYEFVITALTSQGLIFTTLMLVMLIIQIRQFFAGQVKYELKKKITQYSLGLANTKNEIFGSSGYLIFLLPFVSTVLPGDGSFFPSHNDKKND